MKPIITALVLTLLTATTASADPFGVSDPRLAKPQFYVGLQTGSGGFTLSEPLLGLSEADYTLTGVYGGVNRQLTNFVTGIEFDASRIIQEDSDYRHKLFTVKSRVGWSIGRYLSYAMLGTAIIYPDDPQIDPSTGVIFGVGGEVAVTENLALGLEYASQWHHNFAGQPGLDLKVSQVLLRTAFRF